MPTKEWLSQHRGTRLRLTQESRYEPWPHNAQPHKWAWTYVLLNMGYTLTEIARKAGVGVSAVKCWNRNYRKLHNGE